MTTVAELIPGQIIDLPGMPDSDDSATFVAQTEHPLWPSTRLVVWKLADGTWSHDSLADRQYVGIARPSTPAERQVNLRRALLHRSQW